VAIGFQSDIGIAFSSENHSYNLRRFALI